MQITEAERRHLSQCRTKRCVHSPRATDEKQTNWSKGRHFLFLQFIPNKTRIAEKIDRRVAELWTKHANESLPTIQVGRKI